MKIASKPKIWTSAVSQMGCLGTAKQRTQVLRVDQMSTG